MIPKIIKGHSFKGAAAYLLHDKDKASTSKRIDWVHTINLQTKSPDTAWKVMSATAIDQARLKQEAGVKNTGRQSNMHVVHVVLSWHEEEKNDLDRDQMQAAGEAALKAIGVKDHQVMMIAHNDTSNPHIHMLVNRVSPTNGKMLTLKNDQRKLSSWALKYRKDRGQEQYCKQRQLNADARKRGDQIKYQKKSRQDIEAEKLAKTASNDNSKNFERTKKQIKEKTRKLAMKGAATLSRHKQQWKDLEITHTDKLAQLFVESKKAKARSRREIAKQYRPFYEELKRTEAREQAQFMVNEQSHIGRVRNALKLMDTTRSAVDGERLNVLSQTFKGMFNANDRAKLLEHHQQRRVQNLEAKQRNENKQAQETLKRLEKDKVQAQNHKFIAKRSALEFIQGMEKAELRTGWRTLSKHRIAAYNRLEKSHTARKEFSKMSFRERMKADGKDVLNKAIKEQNNDRDKDRER
jgi:hypothetical protein